MDSPTLTFKYRLNGTVYPVLSSSEPDSEGYLTIDIQKGSYRVHINDLIQVW